MTCACAPRGRRQCLLVRVMDQLVPRVNRRMHRYTAVSIPLSCQWISAVCPRGVLRYVPFVKSILTRCGSGSGTTRGPKASRTMPAITTRGTSSLRVRVARNASNTRTTKGGRAVGFGALRAACGP